MSDKTDTIRTRNWLGLLADLKGFDLVLCTAKTWQRIGSQYEFLVAQRADGGHMLGYTPMEIVGSQDELNQRFLEEALSGKNVKVL